ncbi:ArsR/SmtB family transcription factor [Subtercola lobariae]|uniref:HTH arsR-type domain-containing protein n=1 Tax=Subtercola lobariae TaxID=1588641 RepID=A0A917B8A3_9MICO|nr:ArsR family transcriptional regulator [Subtercola lobariae]GGF30806.1 hypothetical protein GCM10011399_25090 [Subtercola lobariae]
MTTSLVRGLASQPSALLHESDELVIARSYQALGIKSVRVEILRYILSNGETCASDLMREFGLSRNGVLAHLRALTTAGLLHERHDTHPRGSGPITYWRADLEDASVVLDTLVDYVLTTTSGAA